MDMNEAEGEGCRWKGWCRAEGNKGKKKRDKCNNIINILLKKKKMSYRMQAI